MDQSTQDAHQDFDVDLESLWSLAWKRFTSPVRHALDLLYQQDPTNLERASSLARKLQIQESPLCPWVEADDAALAVIFGPDPVIPCPKCSANPSPGYVPCLECAEIHALDRVDGPEDNATITCDTCEDSQEVVCPVCRGTAFLCG